MIKAVLFDLDGTLLDTSEGIKHSVRHTLSKMGCNEITDETILKFVGPPIQNSLMNYCGFDKDSAQKGANIFRDYYKSEALYEAVLYDGVMDMLLELQKRDIKIGVATYKREDYAIDLLNYFHIGAYCSVIHGADNENKLSKADIIERCIKELAVDKKDIVFVGDTVHDALGAETANIKFVAVLWGFGFKNLDDKFEFNCFSFANSVQDIIKIVD